MIARLLGSCYRYEEESSVTVRWVLYLKASGFKTHANESRNKQDEYAVSSDHQQCRFSGRLLN